MERILSQEAEYRTAGEFRTLFIGLGPTVGDIGTDRFVALRP